MEIKTSPAYLSEIPNIDKDFLEMLKIHSEGDSGLIKEIIDDFCIEASQLISEIKKAVISGEQNILLQSVHSLAGISASVGAQKLKEISRIIENSLKKGDLKTAFRFSEDIGDFFREFKNEIKNFSF